jgi:autotransporter-associated beta strand protein
LLILLAEFHKRRKKTHFMTICRQPLLALCGVILLSGALSSRAASGNWNVNADGNWSTAANWSPAVVPGTAAGDVVGLTYNITAARTVTIDTTSRTVGTLGIGDSGSPFYAYTLAASGGAGLTFNNSGSTANLVQTTTTAADSISAPLTLAADLSISNSSTLTLSGIIGDGGAGKGITKTGAGTLTLSGANTYSGGTTISNGALVGVVGGGCSNSAVQVAAASGNAATLGISITDNTKQWACSSLTVNNGGATSSLDFNFGSVAPSTTLAPLKVAGAATFTTTPAVTVEGNNFGPAGTQYPLVTWGSTSGTAPANVTLTGGTGAAHLTVSGSTLYLVIDSLVILAPVPGSNTLNIAITAAGTITYLFIDYPINTADSQTAQLAGTQPLGLAANFASATQQGTVTGLEFFDGDIEVTNTLNWTLDLGLLGTVNLTGSDIVGQLHTPHPMSLVSGGTTFALADHDLILDGGTLNGSATGLAAGLLTPFTNDLAADPIEGPVATNGNGTVTLSSPTVVGSTASYNVTVTLPVNSSSLLLTNPVEVTVAITGTMRWQGTLTRLLVPATNLAIVATGPASFRVSGLGGAGQTYGLYASTNLAAPMTNWWLIGATNADAGGVIQFLDTQATNTQRFYRFAQ